jgi:hypothetical protein
MPLAPKAAHFQTLFLDPLLQVRIDTLRAHGDKSCLSIVHSGGDIGLPVGPHRRGNARPAIAARCALRPTHFVKLRAPPQHGTATTMTGSTNSTKARSVAYFVAAMTIAKMLSPFLAIAQAAKKASTATK